MDNEMKAKIDGILKATSTRELSMDEMSKVNGGTAPGAVWHYGSDIRFMTEQEILDFGRSMVNSFGYDIAADVFCTGFGLSKTEIDACHNGGCSDVTNMETLVDRLMKIQDNIEDHGRSF